MHVARNIPKCVSIEVGSRCACFVDWTNAVFRWMYWKFGAHVGKANTVFNEVNWYIDYRFA